LAASLAPAAPTAYQARVTRQKLLRYAATRWARVDRFRQWPPAHSGDDAFAFAVLFASGGEVPSERTIRRTLDLAKIGDEMGRQLE
jgi:hypothetical protein